MEAFLSYELVTPAQFNFLHNLFSFTFAAFLAATIGFFMATGQVERRYRLAMIVAGIVPLIAAYHYFQILQSWDAAYVWTATGGIEHTNEPFNVAYRYADWLLTVPLLMIELVEILKLKGGKGRRLATRLALAAAVMIALGYPGEVTGSETVAWTFWVLSMIPFLGIFFYLVTRFGKHIEEQPAAARPWLNGARWLTACVWWVYPIVFLFPLFGWRDGSAIATMNALFAVADLAAKVGLGLLIAAVAFAKSRHDRESALESSPGSTPATAAG